MSFKPLPIGIENFEKMITEGYYYIDKTLLIKELLDNKGYANLFTRPRRFGKTLTMSMLQYFFEKNEDDTAHLFSGLAIADAGDKYLSHMGKYPVISITLKGIEGDSYPVAYKRFVNVIADEFRRHRYLLDSEVLYADVKEQFNDILLRKADETDYTASLQLLTYCLKQHHGMDVIVLIDEYDVPLEKAYFANYYKEMINLLRPWLSDALKTNLNLAFAVLTGCLRISKESIFTGLNNFHINSISTWQYSECFGFTQDEVTELLSCYNLSSQMKSVKEWYDGYLFGNTEVYNPWSVLMYCYDLMANNEARPKPYWSTTSSNDIVRKLIERADATVKENIEELIRGESINKVIQEDITYDEMDSGIDNIWSFLYHTGYLKHAAVATEEKDIQMVSLTIPNNEIKQIFIDKIRNWFMQEIHSVNLSKLFTAVLSGETGIFEDELTKLLISTISYQDYYENFYHGFLAGILSSMKDCIVLSNRESGKGRNDIQIKIPMQRKAVIIEIKIAKSYDGLDKACDNALNQIKENHYENDLLTERYNEIISYGVSFYKKECKVKVAQIQSRRDK